MEHHRITVSSLKKNGIKTYLIEGDYLETFTKRDCAYRIRRRCMDGYFSPSERNDMIKKLKTL